MTATAVRFDTTNRGGIAKDFRSGIDFRVECKLNGEWVTLIHNTSSESLPKLYERLGVDPTEAFAEKLS